MNWWHVLEICACVPKTCLRGWALATRRARGTVWQAHAFSPRRGATTASIKIPCRFFDLRLSLTKGVRLFHARWSILAKVVSWILIAWRWERSAKRNWIRALWTWWLSSYLDCTSFGCFEYCGLCRVFVWDSQNNGVFVTLKWGSGFSKRTAQRRGFGIRFIYYLKWGWLLQTFETKTCWRSQIQMEILSVFGSLSADLSWAHRPFTRFTCHHKSPLALPGRLEWKRRRLERGRGGPWLGGQYVAMLLNIDVPVVDWMQSNEWSKSAKSDFWSGCRLKVRKDR